MKYTFFLFTFDFIPFTVSAQLTLSAYCFTPPTIHFSMILFHLYKTTLDTARVVIDFTPYIPFRRLH